MSLYATSRHHISSPSTLRIAKPDKTSPHWCTWYTPMRSIARTCPFSSFQPRFDLPLSHLSVYCLTFMQPHWSKCRFLIIWMQSYGLTRYEPASSWFLCISSSPSRVKMQSLRRFAISIASAAFYQLSPIHYVLLPLRRGGCCARFVRFRKYIVNVKKPLSTSSNSCHPYSH